MSSKIKVLMLCTGNSCRSQMAEGWARALKGDQIEVWWAGIETHGMNPNAIKVMAEAGIDISSHHSKNVNTLLDVPFDFVVTVCGHADETCPSFPSKTTRKVHVGFDDPPKIAREIAAHGGSEDEQLNAYRRVRDEIRQWVLTLPDSLNSRA